MLGRDLPTTGLMVNVSCVPEVGVQFENLLAKAKR